MEVTVTGQRGWVNETNRELAADMTGEAQIWISPKQGIIGQAVWALLERSHHHFPLNKANAIKVNLHHPGNPEQPIFPVRKGETTNFKIPDFARHVKETWAVGNLEVEIGPIGKTRDTVVDKFNKLVMTAFNVASGNMLQPGNVLAWNVWFEEPKLVNQHEWRTHAERWRKSIDEHHGPPDGPGTKARYFDGSEFNPVDRLIEDATDDILKFLKEHFKGLIKYLEGLF